MKVALASILAVAFSCSMIPAARADDGQLAQQVRKAEALGGVNSGQETN